MADDPDLRQVERDGRLLGDRTGDRVERGEDVGGHLVPPAARTEPAVFDVPDGDAVAGEVDREARAQVQVVLPAPEAAVDDHHHRDRGGHGLLGRVEVPELLRFGSVRDANAVHGQSG